MKSDPDDAPLRIFTIYENPSDYPGRFVVRETECRAGELRVAALPLAVTKTLDEARARVPAGLWRFIRSAQDDPCIREVWL